MKIDKINFYFKNNKLDEYFDQYKEEIVKNNKIHYFHDYKLENKDILCLFDELNKYIKKFNDFSLKKNSLDKYLDLYKKILFIGIAIIRNLKIMYDQGYNFAYFYAVKLYEILSMKFSEKKQMDMLNPVVLSIINELKKNYIDDSFALRYLNKNVFLRQKNPNTIFLNNIYCSLLGRELEYNLINSNKLYYAYCINRNCRIKLGEFNQLSSYYKISDLRLIEKIESRYKKFNSIEKKMMKIAIFGNMNVKKLKNILNDENIHITIDIFHIKEKNNLIFENNIKETVCLYNFNEVKSLVDKYELIFLLDNGYFYKSYEKDISFFFNTEYSEKKVNLIQKKKFYIRELYNEFNILYDGFLTNKVTAYKYNEKLYYLLNNAVQNNDCEVYMYISKESKEQKQLFSNSIFCKDEYYNGYNTTVVRLSKSFNKNYSKYFKILKSIDNNCIFSFKLWKLFKSVSDDFCFDLFELYKKEKIFEKLYHTDVYLEFEFENLSIKKINYFITDEKIIDFGQIAIDYLSFCLNAIFTNKNFYFKSTLENIFFSILLSCAKDIQDLFIIYLMKYHIADISQIEIIRSKINMPFINDNNNTQFSFQSKKQIENIMINLDQLVLRNSTNKIKYIKEYFYLTNKDISYDDLLEIIKILQILCEKYNYTSCNLFTNIKDFKN